MVRDSNAPRVYQLARNWHVQSADILYVLHTVSPRIHAYVKSASSRVEIDGNEIFWSTVRSAAIAHRNGFLIGIKFSQL